VLANAIDISDPSLDEIDHLTEAFESKGVPVPRTEQSIARLNAHLDELREKLQTARDAFERCRDANPLPADLE
jgi:predicted  nucleic acid-binding Zn-ribbon protein